MADKIRFTISLERKTHEKLRKLAFRGRVSINSIINKIIAEYFINR
jgi:hypothetical protein